MYLHSLLRLNFETEALRFMVLRSAIELLKKSIKLMYSEKSTNIFKNLPNFFFFEVT